MKVATQILFALLAVVAAVDTASAVPQGVSFAGRLAGAEGPVDGTVAIQFRLYDGDSAVWEEEHGEVQVAEGLFAVTLGSIDPEGNPLDEAVFAGSSLSLEVVVDGEVLSPRIDIRAIPYAMRSATSDTLGNLGPGDVALAGHDHDGRYLPAGNGTCQVGQVVTGIDGSTGDVICAADRDTQYTAGGGLALAGTTFSIPSGAITEARLAAGAVTAAKIGSGQVTGTHIGSGQVRLSELNGTEIQLFETPAGCGGGFQTSSSPCGTEMCSIRHIGNGFYVPRFKDCAGDCASDVPSVCPVKASGLLLAPNIGQ